MMTPPAIQTISNEVTTLNEFLDFHRSRILWMIDDVDDTQLHQRCVPSLSTLGGIVKHLAKVEDIWFVQRFLGEAASEPWKSAKLNEGVDWDFESSLTDSKETIRSYYLLACERSRDAIRGITDLGVLSNATNTQGEFWNLRWILTHMIEETAQHSGHLDILKELILA